MDSLKEIYDHVLRPARLMHAVRWTQSNNRFTGISSALQTSLGIVRIPIGLVGIARSSYSADVVGDEASKCPGLVPLISLLTKGCVISCGYFSNKDGLLGIRARGGFCAQRLLLTDSGHYLLPITNFHSARDHHMDRLVNHDYHSLNKAAQQPTRQSIANSNFISGVTTLHTDQLHDDEAQSFQ